MMTIEDLNAMVDSGEIDEFIRVCEARQCKELSKIADAVTARPDVRLVLVAGASSAGKTTTAKRMVTQLRVNGKTAIHLSSDDYFVGDRLNPRDENGELDYESVECVNRARLAADLNGLLEGRSVRLRRFDFARHEGYDPDEPTTLAEGGIIVFEGIHALNPLLTEGVPDACKFRLYIDPMTQPAVFARTRLDSSDARLLRRLVRDNSFRKMSPRMTFSMWPKVRAGEKKWIEPFRGNANAEFDSSLAYELSVLKPYAAGLLARVLLADPACGKALVLSELLSAVRQTDSTKVPGDSILRETIGGSQLEY
jgi:uridine kinase